MDQKHLQRKEPAFTWPKEGQGWGWSLTCAGVSCDLVLSWGPPALPPEPRQEWQGTLSVFLGLFLS